MKLRPCPVLHQLVPSREGRPTRHTFCHPPHPPITRARALRVSKGRVLALPDSLWSRGRLTAEAFGLVKELLVPDLLQLPICRLHRRLGALLGWSVCVRLPVSLGLAATCCRLLQAKPTAQTPEHPALGAAVAVPITADPSRWRLYGARLPRRWPEVRPHSSQSIISPPLWQRRRRPPVRHFRPKTSPR